MDSSLRERIHMIRKQLKAEKRKAAEKAAEKAEADKAAKLEAEMMKASEPEPVPSETTETPVKTEMSEKTEKKADAPGLLGKLSKWIWRS